MLTSSGLDLESQQTVLLTPRNPPRERWRRAVFLSLHERNLIHRADDRGSLAFLRSLSSCTSYYSAFTSFDDDTREADIVEILTESPESVNLDGENDNCIRDAERQLQQANIAKMVKEKDLDSIHKFGGIQGIAEALGTDLKMGISLANVQDVRSRGIPCTLSTTQTSALGFLQFLPKSCNNYTILLLFACAVLSLGFGVKEEGLRTGWYEGVIIILAIIILVVIDSLRNQCRLKHSQRMSGKHKPFELQRMMVDVIRGGRLHKVIIGDVLIGDLVRLERDYIVPADGLFTGESLKLDDDLESTIKGHIVAMVGVKTNAIPALKEADVGITTRICSTEMARASSGIIIGDENLSFLVTILRFGRCTFENIQKYIQLELTMNIAGLLITTITTMFCGYSPITSIQLLWANFVVSLLGGIGLLTEPPTEELMEKLPLKQTKPLITKAMWRNIVSQALYQVTISVAFQFKGQTIPGISNKVSKTIIFNSFVLCQVFNQVNARELEKKNVFKSIHRNPLFWVSVGVILILQVAFIEIAHIIVGNARLNWVQWFSCLLAGMVSWASDWVTKSTAELWNCLTRLLGSHLRTINIPRNSTSNLELPLTHP